MFTKIQERDGAAGFNTPSGPGSATTTPLGFTAATIPGSLLVCVVWAEAQPVGAGIYPPTGNLPITPGFSWTLVASSSFTDDYNSGINIVSGAILVYIISNALSMGTSVTTTVTAYTANPSGPSNLGVAFSLFEISGSTASNPVEAFVVGSYDGNGGAATLPGAGPIVVSNTDFVLVACCVYGYPVTAGIGYTLAYAVSPTMAGGSGQYNPNVLPGTVQTSFGGLAVAWACLAVAFTSAVVTPPPPPLLTAGAAQRGHSAPQVLPLNNAPNQSFSISLSVDGKPLLLRMLLRYNEIAKYWVLSVRDKFNKLLIDSIPLVTGNDPACNILGQFAYLNIGSAYVLNLSGTKTRNFPDNNTLGTDFALVWGDTP